MVTKLGFFLLVPNPHYPKPTVSLWSLANMSLLTSTHTISTTSAPLTLLYLCRPCSVCYFSTGLLQLLPLHKSLHKLWLFQNSAACIITQTTHAPPPCTTSYPSFSSFTGKKCTNVKILLTFKSNHTLPLHTCLPSSMLLIPPVPSDRTLPCTCLFHLPFIPPWEAEF